ncbi:hypothetical protein RIF29_09849 [Crotalaria pallida]|uniref:Uncharacterized protein n=1 Tax=Crotalaria pallida TaxID=3830 RepID=A0AAN9IJM0_CROPI
MSTNTLSVGFIQLHEFQCTIDDLKCTVRIIEGMVDGTTSFKSNLFADVDPWDAYRVDPAEKSKAENQPPPTEPSVLYISVDDDYDVDAPRSSQFRPARSCKTHPQNFVIGRSSSKRKSSSTTPNNERGKSNSRSSFKKPKIEKETAGTEQVAATTMRLGTPVSSGKKSNMPSSNNMNTKKQQKRKTCLGQAKVMNKVLCSMECPIDDSLRTFDITTWPISSVDRVQNLGDRFFLALLSDDSAYWLLNLLLMEYAFQPFVASEIDIDKVKMRITLALISERFNVLYSKTECQAQLLMQAMEELS